MDDKICLHRPRFREDEYGYIFVQCEHCMIVTTACKSRRVAMEKFDAGKVFECHSFIGELIDGQ